MPTDRIEARRIEASEAVRPILAVGSRVPMVSNEARAMCDRRDTTSTELPVFAGGFLFSTSAGKSAGRFTGARSG